MATPLRLLTGTVLARRHVTPGMVRVTLGGAGLAGLASTGTADEYVRLFFPDAETGEVVLPLIDAAGAWTYPDGRRPAHCECYTIRHVRPGEIDIDFVVHDHGRASAWAQAAEPGDTITIREPHGIYEPPAGLQWLLLACDATGLPAAGRLLEGLHPSIEVRVVVEVPDASHEQLLTSPARLRLAWLHGSGNGIGPSRLPEAVAAMVVPEDVVSFVWVASEVKAVRRIRKYLRHELGWQASRYSCTGYWTERAAEWKAGWEALDPAIRRQIDDLWASGRDGEQITDEVEATLETFGL